MIWSVGIGLWLVGIGVGVSDASDGLRRVGMFVAGIGCGLCWAGIWQAHKEQRSCRGAL